MPEKTPHIAVILGPTATGKTRLAALLAHAVGGEVISADSRQVYRGMDWGTGKDYDDYVVGGAAVPYHLIDVCDAGDKYNVFRYQQDFVQAFNDISGRNRRAVVCGGTGMYLEAALKGFELVNVPPDEVFRAECEDRSFEDMAAELRSYKDLHNCTDLDTRKRLVRALEIERYMRMNKLDTYDYPQFNYTIIGVDVDRELRRGRVTARLKSRVDAGLVAEVERLIAQGVDPETLIYYGLEYKFVTMYVTGKMGYDEMLSQLNIAIHQFAKRQMTWFRGMERRGFDIHWIDGSKSPEDRLVETMAVLSADGFFQ